MSEHNLNDYLAFIRNTATVVALACGAGAHRAAWLETCTR